MKYFKRVEGENIYLSPINIEDAGKYAEWLNDFDIVQHLIVSRRLISAEKERELLKGFENENQYIFGIIDKLNDLLIGNTGLHYVDFVDSIAEIGIFIGDKNYWNKGYGAEAMNLTLDFAFNVLNLKTIVLEVFEYNKRAIKSYEKIGFKHSGRLRSAKEICGKRYDILLMDILSDEFESPYFKNKMKESLKNKEKGV